MYAYARGHLSYSHLVLVTISSQSKRDKRQAES